jgi:hypothetical protein
MRRNLRVVPCGKSINSSRTLGPLEGRKILQDLTYRSSAHKVKKLRSQGKNAPLTLCGQRGKDKIKSNTHRICNRTGCTMCDSELVGGRRCVAHPRGQNRQENINATCTVFAITGCTMCDSELVGCRRCFAHPCGQSRRKIGSC